MQGKKIFIIIAALIIVCGVAGVVWEGRRVGIVDTAAPVETARPGQLVSGMGRELIMASSTIYESKKFTTVAPDGRKLGVSEAAFFTTRSLADAVEFYKRSLPAYGYAMVQQTTTKLPSQTTFIARKSPVVVGVAITAVTSTSTRVELSLTTPQ